MSPSVIFITGMSGAGRSTTLKIFEDLGYAVIDNLPHFMLRELRQGVFEQQVHLPVVVGFDVRAYQENTDNVLENIQQFKNHLETRLIFLDCQDEILMRRYSVTRHRHPLAGKTIFERVKAERHILLPVLKAADHVIDTSLISPITLGRIVKKAFAKSRESGLEIHVISFSYKKGLPIEADIVFDARLLDNPYYEEDLRPLTGRDPAVATYINRDKNLQPILDGFKMMLKYALQGYKKSGRNYLTVAIGCTGGQHRSVYLTEQIGAYLEECGEKVNIEHREL